MRLIANAQPTSSAPRETAAPRRRIRVENNTNYGWLLAHLIASSTSARVAMKCAADAVRERELPLVAGSIRIPASLCGIAGLKRTCGRMSRHGAISNSLTFDHALAWTVEDCVRCSSASRAMPRAISRVGGVPFRITATRSPATSAACTWASCGTSGTTRR
jgi:hypothetical protein